MTVKEAFEKNLKCGIAFQINTSNGNNGKRVNVVELPSNGNIVETKRISSNGSHQDSVSVYEWNLKAGTVGQVQIPEGRYVPSPCGTFSISRINGEIVFL